MKQTDDDFKRYAAAALTGILSNPSWHSFSPQMYCYKESEILSMAANMAAAYAFHLTTAINQVESLEDKETQCGTTA